MLPCQPPLLKRLEKTVEVSCFHFPSNYPISALSKGWEALVIPHGSSQLVEPRHPLPLTKGRTA